MPSPRSRRILVTLPPQLLAQLESTHHATHLTKSQLITLALQSSLHTVARAYLTPQSPNRKDSL